MFLVAMRQEGSEILRLSLGTAMYHRPKSTARHETNPKHTAPQQGQEVAEDRTEVDCGCRGPEVGEVADTSGCWMWNRSKAFTNAFLANARPGSIRELRSLKCSFSPTQESSWEMR